MTHFNDPLMEQSLPKCIYCYSDINREYYYLSYMTVFVQIDKSYI